MIIVKHMIEDEIIRIGLYKNMKWVKWIKKSDLFLYESDEHYTIKEVQM